MVDDGILLFMASETHKDKIVRLIEAKNILHTTNLEFRAEKKQGKVRDIYDLGESMILITTGMFAISKDKFFTVTVSFDIRVICTDRISAFDRVISNIPCKGQVLNELSAWWFKKTSHIVPNHLIELNDPNCLLVKKCKGNITVLF
eukprot:TRINITY_DN7282_c0_g1_i1.p1 TRINITY_DN7282_c0_g1~~TRINITY_DN7282_c0_g1_i1.p1  ORF type:complete len:146 (-),score=6.02 TRINITY_DN7282_c0_g1_i1:130-567(-)